MGMDADKEASFSAVYVNERQIENAALHEYRKCLAGAEGRCAADQITRVALGHRGVAGADLLVAGLPCELLGGDLAVAVHQDDERVTAFVFHDECLDH